MPEQLLDLSGTALSSLCRNLCSRNKCICTLSSMNNSFCRKRTPMYERLSKPARQ
nr:hypothetical protein Q903MT_gene267 [Picea sitchensis]